MKKKIYRILFIIFLHLLNVKLNVNIYVFGVNVTCVFICYLQVFIITKLKTLHLKKYYMEIFFKIIYASY